MKEHLGHFLAIPERQLPVNLNVNSDRFLKKQKKTCFNAFSSTHPDTVHTSVSPVLKKLGQGFSVLV